MWEKAEKILKMIKETEDGKEEFLLAMAEKKMASFYRKHGLDLPPEDAAELLAAVMADSSRELTDEELEAVSGGDPSYCYKLYFAMTGNHVESVAYCA